MLPLISAGWSLYLCTMFYTSVTAVALWRCNDAEDMRSLFQKQKVLPSRIQWQGDLPFAVIDSIERHLTRQNSLSVFPNSMSPDAVIYRVKIIEKPLGRRVWLDKQVRRLLREEIGFCARKTSVKTVWIQTVRQRRTGFAPASRATHLFPPSWQALLIAS